MKRLLYLTVAALCLASTGCVGTTKLSMTMDKTIDLGTYPNPLEGPTKVGIRLEIFSKH